MSNPFASPLGCLASIAGAVVGAFAGYRFLWPLIARLILHSAPPTSPDNQAGAVILAFPIAVLLGAAIGFVIPMLVVTAYQFIKWKRSED